jgi:hypothetical protein
MVSSSRLMECKDRGTLHAHVHVGFLRERAAASLVEKTAVRDNGLSVFGEHRLTMIQTRLASAVALGLGWLVFAQGAEQERRNTRPLVPLVAHHQHLFELAALMTSTAFKFKQHA